MITRAQLNSVRKMLHNRAARISQDRTYIEVRGTTRLANAAAFVADVESLESRLGIVLVVVDPAIYDLAG